MEMSWISFHIQKDILSYPKRYLFISINDILEISSIGGYLKISQDKSGYLKISFWGELPDVACPM
jgi:hypothetical protein